MTQSLVKADLNSWGSCGRLRVHTKTLFAAVSIPAIPAIPPPSQDTLEEVHQQAETFQGRQKRSSLSSHTFTAGKQPIPGWMPFPFPQG